MVDDPLAPLARLPDVAEALAAARAAVDGLLGHRILRRRSAEVSAEAGLRSARASAALDGSDLPLEQVREGTGDPVVQGALRVSSGVGGLVDTLDHAPLQALARLHVLAAGGLAAADDLGRPRTDPLVGARVAALAQLVAGRQTSSALLLAAVVHGELLALTPFGTANGVVARAAGRLVLVSRGLDPKAVTAPEVGHLELVGDYRATAAGYAAGEPGPWLVHCAEAVRLGAREGLAICETLLRADEIAG